MSQPALPPPEDKRAFVQAMFDRIAPRYDRMNRLISFGLDRGWRRRGLARLRLAPGARVIDLASGTGDFTELAQAQGARAVGVDFSGGMLREARRARPALTLLQGDGAALPLRSACAAAITCGFALRNFADLPAVLGECARVLKPGGLLLVLEVYEPRWAWLRAAHGVHLRHVVPRLGAWLGESAAYRYLPESTTYLPSPPALAALLDAAGFEPPRRHLHGLGAVQCVIARRRAGAAQ